MIINSSIGRYGRFGNQLFQVASLIGIAKRSNQPWAIPTWTNYDHVERFGSKEPVDLYRHFVNEFPDIPLTVQLNAQQKNYVFGYHHIVLPHGDWDLSGHFQSPKYFDHCIDEVRHWLTMKDEPSPLEYTAIHVRLGDYDDRYHPRLTMDYYEEAMQCIPGPYMVFSDDIDAAMEMFGRKARHPEFTYVLGKDYIESFKMMKACKNFIIGNSSYSLMAAILANQTDKKVVAPINWFGEAWGSCCVEMSKDVYGEGWIAI